MTLEIDIHEAMLLVGLLGIEVDSRELQRAIATDEGNGGEVARVGNHAEHAKLLRDKLTEAIWFDEIC